LVNEVTINAVRHTASGTAEGTFRFSYELRDDRLRVEVYDAGALTAPQRRAPAGWMSRTWMTSPPR
jgi:anti-sigma regulatory factor (Ser/Thr protein kinase)